MPALTSPALHGGRNRCRCWTSLRTLILTPLAPPSTPQDAWIAPLKMAAAFPCLSLPQQYQYFNIQRSEILLRFSEMLWDARGGCRDFNSSDIDPDWWRSAMKQTNRLENGPCIQRKSIPDCYAVASQWSILINSFEFLAAWLNGWIKFVAEVTALDQLPAAIHQFTIHRIQCR